MLLFDAGLLRGALQLRLRATPAALRRVRMAFHEGLPGSVFVSGQGRLVALRPRTTTAGTRDRVPRGGGRAPSARSALCVPISLPQEKLGVLLLESATAPDAFQAEDLRFAATLAHQAAIAIGNALRLQRMLEMDRQRQAYLSNVSHELRTPLTVVQGYVEALLAGGRRRPGRTSTSRIAQEQCAAAGPDDRRGAGGLAPRARRGPAPPAVGPGGPRRRPWPAWSRRSARRPRSRASPSTARLEDGLPVLTGDERLLQPAGHEPASRTRSSSRPAAGQVDVDLAAQRRRRWCCGCATTGIGIAAEHHERIFEKFFMVDGGATKARGGAGIGLYLAREVVAIHDGAIAVESAPGEGALLRGAAAPSGPARRRRDRRLRRILSGLGEAEARR